MNRVAKVVSFDVYDTLIRRVVSPRVIYQRMEKELVDSGDVRFTHFCKRRIESEDQLKSQGADTYTLRDIYHQKPFLEWPEEKIGAVMEMECEMELENTLPTVLGQQLFHKYENEYVLICVSDMYFDSGFIKKCLQKNGYTPSRVYVSSEIGKSKRRRELFKYVLQDMNIEPSEMLHIGDAVRSDWLHARVEGIHGKWLHTKDTRQPSADELYNLGYSVLGPVLFAFCKWVRSYSSRGKMLFLAREGEFFKRCYDILYPGNKGEVLYLSRKSVIQGTAYVLLRDWEADKFYELVNIERGERIEEVFRRLGLDARQYEMLLAEECLTTVDLYDKRIVPFFQKNRDVLLNDMEPNYELFHAYLDEHLVSENVLVDIGWKGRMQDFLQKFIESSGSQVKLSGLYLGVCGGGNKQGFLFDSENKRCHDIRCFSGLLEVLMMPEHGSTIRHEAQGETITPVFDSFEFSKEHYEKIKRVQRGIEEMVEQHRPYLNCSCVDLEQAVKRMVRFGCHPSRKLMKELGPLKLYENGNTYQLIEHISIFHPKEFYKGFFYSKWKSGYLKENFVVDLPYEIMISFARRIMDSKTL